MNVITRILKPIITDFLYTQDDRQATKRIFVENEFGWQFAIPVYSNNGDYGYHIISLVNIDQLGALVYNHTGLLKEMINDLLPKIHIPGYLIEGRTRIYVIDKISGKFLKAKFNKWKNEAFLFFKAKGKYVKGLGDMPIKLRIAWILASFFNKRATRMKETVSAKGKELHGVWVDITEMLEVMAKKLQDWVKKFADPENWNSKKQYIAKQKAEEKKAMEEERERKKEELKKQNPAVIAHSLGKLAWLTDSGATIDKIEEIAKIEGVDWFESFRKIDREANQQGVVCYG